MGRRFEGLFGYLPEKFASLESKDRFSILLSLGALQEENDTIKTLAAGLLRDHLDEFENTNRRVLY